MTLNPQELLNVTNIIEITPKKFIETATNSVAAPMLITFFIISAFVYLVVGLIFVEHQKKKYLGIWALATVISFALLVFWLLTPQFSIDIVNSIGNVFNK